MIGEGGGDDAEQVLFAIVLSAVKEPDTFGADDVILTLKAFGLERMIEEARVFKEDMGEDGDEGDPQEDAEVADLLADIEGMSDG